MTPRADSCEEFWALNPSGNQTATTCNGVSVGEPYREVSQPASQVLKTPEDAMGAS